MSRGVALRNWSLALPFDAPQIAVAVIFAALTLIALAGNRIGVTRAVVTYIPYLWAFFLFFPSYSTYSGILFL